MPSAKPSLKGQKGRSAPYRDPPVGAEPGAVLGNAICFTLYHSPAKRGEAKLQQLIIYMFGTSSKPTATPSTSNANGIHQQPGSYTSAQNRVSSGVSIKGDVKFGSELVIDGEVEGNITSDGKLIIGSHATVVGDIQVGHVTIQGSVEGNVMATERCALEAGAHLNGDVAAPRLAVDENASFVGSATITKKS